MDLIQAVYGDIVDGICYMMSRIIADLYFIPKSNIITININYTFMKWMYPNWSYNEVEKKHISLTIHTINFPLFQTKTFWSNVFDSLNNDIKTE